MRTKAWRRSQRRRVIDLKKTKVDFHDTWNIGCEGRLAKGKIHCSCGRCSYDPKTDQLVKLRRKIATEDMLSQIAERSVARHA